VHARYKAHRALRVECTFPARSRSTLARDSERALPHDGVAENLSVHVVAARAAVVERLVAEVVARGHALAVTANVAARAAIGSELVVSKLFADVLRVVLPAVRRKHRDPRAVAIGLAHDPFEICVRDVDALIALIEDRTRRAHALRAIRFCIGQARHVATAAILWVGHRVGAFAAANDFIHFAARSVVACAAADDVAVAAVVLVGFRINALAVAIDEISAAAFSVEARAVARDAASAAILRVDVRVDANVAALRGAAETSEAARRRAAVRARRAELSLRALRSAHSAVRIIGREIHARRAAVRGRTARPAHLAGRRTFSADAALARIARMAAHSAVVVVGLQIDARLHAIRKTLLTRVCAHSNAAHLACRTFRSALPAVLRIALGAHANAGALRRAAAALKRTGSLHAHLSVHAFHSASAAVIRIAFCRNAIGSASRISVRALHHRCVDDRS